MLTQSVLMTQTDARLCVLQIQSMLENAEKHFQRGMTYYNHAREEIFRLHQYEGWKALGYTSWRECVKAEFSKGQSTLYKQLSAALVEQQINSPIGTIPERVLRPLTHKKYSEDTRKMLWEVAVKVTGNPASVTSGTMNAVVQTLEEAIVTGTLQDEQGTQHPVFEHIKADALARAVESRERHRQYLQSGAGVKIVSAIEAKPGEDDQNCVILRITGTITPEQRKNLLNAKILKITAWSNDDATKTV